MLAMAGSNGVGKTTFFRSHLRAAELRFVKADVLARDLSLDPNVAARIAASLRRELIAQEEIFVPRSPRHTNEPLPGS